MLYRALFAHPTFERTFYVHFVLKMAVFVHSTLSVRFVLYRALFAHHTFERTFCAV